MINCATRNVISQMAHALRRINRHNRHNRGVPLFTCSLSRDGGSRGNDTLVPGGFLSTCERVASAGRKEGEGGKRAEARAGGRDGRMDSFIFLVDLAYISPPPEADTKTNGLSSRSYKTSPPSTSPLFAASRRRLPPPFPSPPPPPPRATCHRMQM